MSDGMGTRRESLCVIGRAECGYSTTPMVSILVPDVKTKFQHPSDIPSKDLVRNKSSSSLCRELVRNTSVCVPILFFKAELAASGL